MSRKGLENVFMGVPDKQVRHTTLLIDFHMQDPFGKHVRSPKYILESVLHEI